jgi:predicted nucleic acid-binding protein
MILVLDTSAALDLVLKKGEFEHFASLVGAVETVLAPEIYISEITNAAWKYNKLAGFSPAESVRIAEDGISLIDKFWPVIDLWRESLRESIRNDHPVYDLLYAVCARRTDGLLLTRDDKLKKICDKLSVRTG